MSQAPTPRRKAAALLLCLYEQTGPPGKRSYRKVAKQVGLNVGTVWKAVKDPEKTSRETLRKLEDRIGFTVERRRRKPWKRKHALLGRYIKKRR